MHAYVQKYEARDYAERIRKRLPRRLQELREAIGRIDGGDTIPRVHVLARLARGLGVTLEKFFGGISPLQHEIHAKRR